jgi:hypothetical protein
MYGYNYKLIFSINLQAAFIFRTNLHINTFEGEKEFTKLFIQLKSDSEFVAP